MTELFDIASKTYDHDFTYTKTGRLQRDMVWKYLNPNVQSSKPLKILELNCGTGEDAIHMAKSGNSVLATDISPEMVSRTREKSIQHKLETLVSSRTIDMRMISEDIGEERFDIIFSNFGGLNCISQIEIQRFKQSIKRLLKPNGRVILVIMPKLCLWESFYFLTKLKVKDAFRRKKESVNANVSGVFVKTWYYSPNDIKKIFAPEFKSVKVKPIGFFGPPSYLESFFVKKKLLFRVFEQLEKGLSRFSWQSKMADHFYIELQAK